MSDFWGKVDEELNFKGMQRKELARIANFPDSYISKGIARKSIPSADLALRISHALNTPLEYLLGMDTAKTNNSNHNKELQLFYKYSEIIKFLENLNIQDRNKIKEFLQKNE